MMQISEPVRNFLVLDPEREDAMANLVCKFQQSTGESPVTSWHGLYFNGANYCKECGWDAETHDIPKNWIVAWR